MKVIPTAIKDVLIVEPNSYHDERGYFLETYQVERYAKYQIVTPFVQDNYSYSKKNVLRGLHYQLKHPQAKLVQVMKGAVYDVAVDVRYGSPTFGHYVGVELNDTNHRQLFIPAGFAHGFVVLSEKAYFLYKCSDYYDRSSEYGIKWNDPEINIDWKLKATPIVSDKDNQLFFLKDITPDKLPIYKNG